MSPSLKTRNLADSYGAESRPLEAREASNEQVLDSFLAAWGLQFARALAPVLNEYPDVRCSRTQDFQAIDFTGVLWWRAMVQCHGSFSLWIGARERTWSKSGKLAQPGKLTWMRLLENVQAAALAELNSSLQHPVQAGPAQIVLDAPDREALCYAVMGIKLAGTELPALLFAIDPAARHELIPSASVSSAVPGGEHLLHLDLPLPVILGRASLPEGEVLKISHGSAVSGSVANGSAVNLDSYRDVEVDVVVQGTVVAKGQVVSQNGNYGVRIHGITGAGDRLKLSWPRSAT